jgi:hypothetical protein
MIKPRVDLDIGLRGGVRICSGKRRRRVFAAAPEVHPQGLASAGSGGLRAREQDRDVIDQDDFCRRRTPSWRGLVAKNIRVGDNGLTAVQRTDLGHLVLAQLEVKHIEVLGDAAWM